MLRTSIRIHVMYMIQYKHAKLFRQCVLFWPRNRLSIERMTAPPTRRPSIGRGVYGAILCTYVVT